MGIGNYNDEELVFILRFKISLLKIVLKTRIAYMKLLFK